MTQGLLFTNLSSSAIEPPSPEAPESAEIGEQPVPGKDVESVTPAEKTGAERCKEIATGHRNSIGRLSP